MLRVEMPQELIQKQRFEEPRERQMQRHYEPDTGRVTAACLFAHLQAVYDALVTKEMS